MATKKIPSVIQVAGGEKYRVTLLKVIERDEDGSPRRFELVRDEESTNIEQGSEFWAVFASERVLRKRN